MNLDYESDKMKFKMKVERSVRNIDVLQRVASKLKRLRLLRRHRLKGIDSVEMATETE